MQRKHLWKTYCSAAIFLIACKNINGPAKNENKAITNPKEVVQLNMVGHWLNEGKREQLLHEFITEFEFVNQDINVNIKFPEEIYKGDEGEVDFIANQVKLPVSDFDILRIKSHYPNVAVKLHDEYWGTKYLVDFSDIPGFRENHLGDVKLDAIK